MRIRAMSALVSAALLSAGCATGVNLINKDNIRQYAEDLNGDGSQEIIEADTGKTADSNSLLKIMKLNRDKTTETMDSVSVPGKIKNVEFAELNLDERKQIVVYSEGKDKLNNIAIYRLKNSNTFSKIFFLSSAYDIETDFEGVPKIKVAKRAPGSNSPNSVPEWDIWTWTGEKFVRER